DRGGVERNKTLSLPKGAKGIQLLLGETYATCQIIAHDSSGNLIRCSLGGNCQTENILPVNKTLNLLTNGEKDCRYSIICEDHVIGLNKDLDVLLDFNMPKVISNKARWIWKEKGWLSLPDDEANQLYILDVSGFLLKKMP